jgi:outer membrane protein assembly factor BamA
MFGVPFNSPQAIRQDVGRHFLLGLRAGVNRDTRDSYLMPSSGSVFDIGVEQVLGSYAFPVATAETTKFWTLHKARDGGWKGVLAMRSQLSVTAGNAPAFERFYAGGFHSLRGFAFRGVGPYQSTTDGTGVVNTGGTFSFLNTLEYQIPLVANERLRLVTFLDHGTVEKNIGINDYRVAVGVGLRIQVPAMGPLPIALDFGIPIVRGRDDQKQLFSFYVGWIGGQ